MSLILQQLLLAARTNIHSSLGSSKSLEGSSVGLAMLSGQRTTFYKELVVGRKGDLCSKAQSPWNLFPFCVITTQISCIHKKFHILTCTSIHLCHALTFMCYHTHRASSKLSKAWHKSFFLAVLARLHSTASKRDSALSSWFHLSLAERNNHLNSERAHHHYRCIYKYTNDMTALTDHDHTWHRADISVPQLKDKLNKKS